MKNARSIYLLAGRLTVGMGVLGAWACSTTWKPCTDGGDVKWDPPVKGNMQCHQRKDEYDKYINHGKFYQYDGKGRVIVEGEFRDGKRSGTWIHYDTEGKKLAKKYFHKGIELPGEVPRGVTDDAYLQAVQDQQKAVNAPQFQFKKFSTPSTPLAPAPAAPPPQKPKRPGPQI